MANLTRLRNSKAGGARAMSDPSARLTHMTNNVPCLICYTDLGIDTPSAITLLEDDGSLYAHLCFNHFAKTMEY